MNTTLPTRKKVSFTCRLEAELRDALSAFSERTGIDQTQIVEEAIRGRMRETALLIVDRQREAILREGAPPCRVSSKPDAAPGGGVAGKVVRGALSGLPQKPGADESTVPASRPAKVGQRKKGGQR